MSDQALPLGDHSTDSVARHTDSVKLDGQRRNLQIQWVRALAATMVMVFHVATYQRLVLHDARFADAIGAGFGFFGVALFFAISGYLMSVAVRVQEPMVFLVHRGLRIYPLYALLCLVFWYVRSLAYPAVFDPASLALMPYPGIFYSALTIEWTLVFEIAFYVSLFFIAWAGLVRRIPVIAALWLVVILAFTWVVPDQGFRSYLPFYRMLTVSACAPMAAGLLLPSLLTLRLPAWPLLALVAIAYVLAEHLNQDYQACRWGYGLSAFCLLWALLIRSHKRTGGERTPAAGRVFARYGDYSYALYLCHVPIIEMLYLKFPDLGVLKLGVLSIASVLVAATLFGQLDVTLYRHLKRGTRHLPPRVIRIAALSYGLLYAAIAVAGSYSYWQQDRNDATAQVLAGQMETGTSAVAMMVKAGYAQSKDLKGSVDQLEWLGSDSHMRLTLWTLDAHKPLQPVYLAVFGNGTLLASGVPDATRRDVDRAYGVSPFARIRTGRVFDFRSSSCTVRGLVVVAFTGDRRFGILPDAPSPICR